MDYIIDRTIELINEVIKKNGELPNGIVYNVSRGYVREIVHVNIDDLNLGNHWLVRVERHNIDDYPEKFKKEFEKGVCELYTKRRKKALNTMCGGYIDTDTCENPTSSFEKMYWENDAKMLQFVNTMRELREVRKMKNMEIKDVIFNDPATIVFWGDGTKTIVKCQDGDTFDKEKGLAMAISKKMLGSNKSKSNFNDIFKKWIPDEEVKSTKKELLCGTCVHSLEKGTFACVWCGESGISNYRSIDNGGNETNDK